MISILAGILFFFSPHGGCSDAAVKQIDAAKVAVWVQAYSFTSVPIEQALFRAKDRGLDVRAIFDKSWRAEMQRNKYASALAVENATIAKLPVLIDDKHQIAHNKVIVIDGMVVVTGSFNFTAQAETSNAENMLVITDANIARAYAANWLAHFAHSVAPTP